MFYYSMKKHDVVIIGAGIAGLSLSRSLEKEGIDFVTLEKRMEVGTYGPRIINLETLEKLSLPKENLIKAIRKINFYSPGGLIISKSDKSTRGYVVNLREIEMHLYNSIKEKNKIKLKENVVDFDLEQHTVKLSNGQDIGFKVLIFATGVLGVKFRNKLRISHPKNVFCYAVEIKAKDEITTILDNELAPGFYGWIIPLGDEIIELGFGAEELNIRDHREIRRRLYSLSILKKYKNKKIIRVNGGFIPTGMIDKKANKNWIVIGDAAGGEPMLGGSIHKCIDEAEMASKVIQENMQGKLFSMRKYEVEWDNILGEEYESQRKIRKMLDTARNADFDRIFKKLDGREIEGKGLINDLFRNIVTNLR